MMAKKVHKWLRKCHKKPNMFLFSSSIFWMGGGGPVCVYVEAFLCTAVSLSITLYGAFYCSFFMAEKMVEQIKIANYSFRLKQRLSSLRSRSFFVIREKSFFSCWGLEPRLCSEKNVSCFITYNTCELSLPLLLLLHLLLLLLLWWPQRKVRVNFLALQNWNCGYFIWSGSLEKKIKLFFQLLYRFQQAENQFIFWVNFTNIYMHLLLFYVMFFVDILWKITSFSIKVWFKC